MNPLDATILKKYQDLPKDLQSAISSIGLPDKIQAISKKHGLRIDQAGFFSNAVVLTLIGIHRPSDFVNTLEKELEIPEAEARALAEDVHEGIFNSVRASLQKIEEEKEAIEVEAEESETTNKAGADINKETVLNSIENPSASSPLSSPINLLAEEYPLVIPGQKSEPTKQTAAPASPAPASTPVGPSLNLMDRMMSAPVSAKNETVEKNVGAVKPAKMSIPGTPDPYREPTE